MELGPSGPESDAKPTRILPAGVYQKAKVALSRNRGTGGKVTMSARCAKALIGAVPRRRFGYFAAAGKVTPSPNK